MTTTLTDTPVGPPAAERETRLLDVARMVERVCSRLGPHDGPDAAQDVLEAVWRAQHRPGFDVDHDGDGSLFGYAATLARYRVLRAYREQGQAPVPVGELAEQLLTDPGADPDEQAQRAAAADQAARQVDQLLTFLTPRQRQVMLASGLGSRPTDETAAALDMWPSSVRTVQYRAMARMREMLGVPSPNPLASGVPERVRQREAAAGRAAANGTAGRGPGGRPLPAEVHEAGRAAAAAGMHARQMAAEFGVSESTASRWRAEALRRAQAEPAAGVAAGRDGADRDRSPTDGDPRRLPVGVNADSPDPVVRARAAVDALPALAAAPAATAGCHASGDTSPRTACATGTPTQLCPPAIRLSGRMRRVRHERPR